MSDVASPFTSATTAALSPAAFTVPTPNTAGFTPVVAPYGIYHTPNGAAVANTPNQHGSSPAISKSPAPNDKPSFFQTLINPLFGHVDPIDPTMTAGQEIGNIANGLPQAAADAAGLIGTARAKISSIRSLHRCSSVSA